MNQPKQDTAILSLIKMTYSGKELEAALKAWEAFPTLKTDKRCEAREKEKLRKIRMERILSGEYAGVHG